MYPVVSAVEGQTFILHEYFDYALFYEVSVWTPLPTFKNCVSFESANFVEDIDYISQDLSAHFSKGKDISDHGHKELEVGVLVGVDLGVKLVPKVSVGVHELLKVFF